mgnify:FL=1
MKKSVILLASAILVVSCDLPAGGNKGRLKKTDEVVRYDDPNAPHGTYHPTADSTKAVSHVVADSAKTVTSEAKPAATAESPAEHH